MPGTHQKFLPYFQSHVKDTSLQILDIGAGYGAFSQRLYNLGFDVSACDLYPEIFRFDKIVCEKADIMLGLPYAENSFDVVVSIEVMEHINVHEVVFRDVNRILKPCGRVFISTPNILSLKSRFRFLFSGFFYSFLGNDCK